MDANYEHAWQLDVEFGQLDAQYSKELCEALMAEYGMSVGIFEDVDEQQYTAILPPPVVQPGLVFYCACDQASHTQQLEEAVGNQIDVAASASVADVTSSRPLDIVDVSQNVQQTHPQSASTLFTSQLPLTANTHVRATNQAPSVPRSHPRAPSKRVTKAQSTHIPRPRNSWIIYRQDRTKDLRAQDPSLTASEISRIVSNLWRDELPQVKSYYQRLAADEAQAHRDKYPNYRYRARRPVDRHTAIDTAAFWDSLADLDTIEN